MIGIAVKSDAPPMNNGVSSGDSDGVLTSVDRATLLPGRIADTAIMATTNSTQKMEKVPDERRAVMDLRQQSGSTTSANSAAMRAFV